MFRGSPVDPILLSSFKGMLTYEGSQSAFKSGDPIERTRTVSAVHRLVQKEAGSIFAATHNANIRSALTNSERIAALLENATLSQDWGAPQSQLPSTQSADFIMQLKQVAQVIASRNAIGAERDIFYVELGGFDHHNELTSNLQAHLTNINLALTIFVNEMKAQGVWNQVAVQAVSEFGRTMTSNGRGTDHAWGGNYFVAGGSVSGAKIHGQYPELRVDGPQSISSTGPMLPSSPWEAIWSPLALWLGVEESQLNTVMPNRITFPSGQLFSLADMFTS